MLQDEQREQDSLLAWFGDGLYDKPSPETVTSSAKRCTAQLRTTGPCLSSCRGDADCHIDL